MADEPGTTLSWLGYAAIATAVGGTVYAGVRRAARVKAARGQLSALLSAGAGNDARVVITGATSGVGEELAREFSLHPAVSLLLGCRDVTAGERLAAACGNASVAKLDCLDLASVKGFTEQAREFLEADAAARPSASGLRLVVNNAGVMSAPQESSADGFEPTWAVNFLAPFAVTELLARGRQPDAQPPLRVVNVSSRLEKRAKLTEQTLGFVENPAAEMKKENKGIRASAYSDSKRAMMLWIANRADTLAADHNTYVSATTPGMVDTQLGRNSMSSVLWPLTKPLRLLPLRSPAEGALSAVVGGRRGTWPVHGRREGTGNAAAEQGRKTRGLALPYTPGRASTVDCNRIYCTSIVRT